MAATRVTAHTLGPHPTAILLLPEEQCMPGSNCEVPKLFEALAFGCAIKVQAGRRNSYLGDEIQPMDGAPQVLKIFKDSQMSSMTSKEEQRWFHMVWRHSGMGSVGRVGTRIGSLLGIFRRMCYTFQVIVWNMPDNHLSCSMAGDLGIGINRHIDSDPLSIPLRVRLLRLHHALLRHLRIHPNLRLRSVLHLGITGITSPHTPAAWLTARRWP
ncbi:hypothetical protein C8J56DRAFT_897726 [Mycena floridula]|nr:hypothetical protein C8J56DRAFT_897726 [Mycena floridula]